MTVMMAILVLPGTPDMMVMTDLRLSHRLFESPQPHPVLAEFAVHVRTAWHRFVRPLDKDIQQQGMCVEIIGTKKVRIRMPGNKF